MTGMLTVSSPQDSQIVPAPQWSVAMPPHLATGASGQ